MRRALILALVVGSVGASAASAQPVVAPFAGTPGQPGAAGDGGPSTNSLLRGAIDVATASGGTLIADQGNDSIRRVRPDGVITTIAGPRTPTDLSATFSSDGALSAPAGVAQLGGGVLIADAGHDVVQLLEGGRLHVVAGTGPGFGPLGDGGPATDATLANPTDVVAMPDGGFLVVDQGHQRLRRVAPDGTITTVAGTGTRSFSGDGGPAAHAGVNLPRAAALMENGTILVADAGNNRVRAIVADGTITTVAGNGAEALTGDGGPALAASLSRPSGVAAFAGGMLIADTGNHVVRFVDSSGVISTWAGGFVAPYGLATTASGSVLVADPAASAVFAVGSALAAPQRRLTLQLLGLPARQPHGFVGSIRFVVSAPARIYVSARNGRRGRWTSLATRRVGSGPGAVKVSSRARRTLGRTGSIQVRVRAVSLDGRSVKSLRTVRLG
jgi:hypothetical protein